MESFFKDQLQAYRNEARDNRLPFYRDWSQPYILDGMPLFGLPVLFLPRFTHAWRNYQTFGGDSINAGTFQLPVFDAVGEGDQLKFIQVKAAAKAAQLPPLPQHNGPTLGELCHKLGFQYQLGAAFNVDDNLITVPRQAFADDFRAETARLLSRLVWRREHEDDLGGELLFGLWANFAGFACNTMTLGQASKQTLAEMDAQSFSATCFAAFKTALDVVGAVYGPAAALVLGETAVEVDEASADALTMTF